jgi:AraC-like DNA-binding protein
VDFSRLLELCNRFHAKPTQGACELPGLSIYRRESTSRDVEAYIYEPVVCLVLQGSKVASTGDRVVNLKPGEAVLVSHDLPIVSRITKASPREPYVAAILSLDLPLLRSLYAQIAELPTSNASRHALATGPAETIWLGPLVRYFELLENPLDAAALGPSTLREIHYRLLFSSIGGMLQGLWVFDSHPSRIARAIQHLRHEYHSDIGVEDLAKTAGMSVSSFHEHFKAVTGSTPLQYKKDLRLIRARTLLTTMNQTVSEAAYAVGYQSPNHFSRDYSRKFGFPPSKNTTVSD